MKPDKSKRELVRELADLAGDGPTPDRTDLWTRLITGDYPEDPAERHPQINRWLDIAMGDDGVVNCGFDAPEWFEPEPEHPDGIGETERRVREWVLREEQEQRDREQEAGRS